MYTNIAFAMAFMGPLVLGLLLGLYHKKIIPVVAVVGVITCYVLAVPVIGSIDTRAANEVAMRERQAARAAARVAVRTSNVVTFNETVDLQSALSDMPQAVEVSVKALSVYQASQRTKEFVFSDAGRGMEVGIYFFHPENQYWSDGGYRGPTDPLKTEQINDALVETFYLPRVEATSKQRQSGRSELVPQRPALYVVGVTVPIQGAAPLKAHCHGSAISPAALAEMRAICVTLTARALSTGTTMP
ncbi:hypothetical protein [Deinococcus sp. Leaf326]|uniref:hypothetical protein n=1 Tax=Deinococcus sp. Leaf326 TaxID=1736338 RepID=UPI0006FA711E|nr:hypothetical protein [Deinococcus sp. Leaf326]KQR33166.1 hypothetical protein ASF71_16885 [Deinococcus sp. Leaf326]